MIGEVLGWLLMAILVGVGFAVVAFPFVLVVAIWMKRQEAKEAKQKAHWESRRAHFRREMEKEKAAKARKA